MLGPDNDFVYQYGDNIVELSKSGFRDADDISDERFSDSENLMDKARKSLKVQPELSIELDSIELLDKELGERI
ncbi:hypothetical protein ACDX69_11155 [Lysinibacillus fusiformis]